MRKVFFFEGINNRSGQALLVIILVMVVALTVGLSVAVRTTSNLRTSSENENSERAFSAAEAGIEQSLSTNSSISTTSLANNSSYETTVSTSGGGDFDLNNGSVVLKDEPVDVWLSSYPSYASPWSGNLSINWGTASDTCSASESTNTQAAIEVVLIFGTKASPKTTTYHLDPCAARASSNNFDNAVAPGDTVNGKSYAHKKSIPIASGLIARIIPLYAPTAMALQKGAADPSLPSQGSVVTSTGSSDNTKRKIVSFRSHPKLPIELFPFIFFSPK